MNITQRIGKNAAVLLLSKVLSAILIFWYTIQIARYLGPPGFGVLCFALAFTRIFGIFTDFGFHLLTVREVSRDNSSAAKYLRNINGMKVVLGGFVLGAIVITINLLDYPAETIRVVYWVGLSIVVASFSQALCSIFHAHQRMEYDSLGKILNALLMLGGVLLAVRLRWTVMGLALLFAVSSVVLLLYNLMVLRFVFKDVFSKWVGAGLVEFDWGFCKPTLKQALPFGLTAVFGMIYHWIGTVMLSTMKGDVVVGWYSAAYRIILVLLLVPSAFDMAVYPVMSRLYVSSRNSLELMCEKGFKYLTFIGIPIGIGGMLLADRIILLVFGSEYVPSIIALQILVWSAVLIFIGAPFASLLNSINKQIILAKIVGVAVALNIFLNLILIPKYSYVGAGIATVISEFLIVLGVLSAAFGMRYRLKISTVVSLLLKVFVSSLVMGIFIVCFKDINLFFLIALSSMIYFGIFYLIKGFNQEDLALAKKIINYSKQ